MAQITLTIPDGVMNRVIDAVATVKGWKSGSGQTKAQFAKAYLISHIKAIVQDYEMNAAGDAARLSAQVSVESDIAIT